MVHVDVLCKRGALLATSSFAWCCGFVGVAKVSCGVAISAGMLAADIASGLFARRGEKLLRAKRPSMVNIQLSQCSILILSGLFARSSDHEDFFALTDLLTKYPATEL